MAVNERKTGSEILERTRQETKEPALYRVLLHNDNYTTMDFVVSVLETVFLKSPAEAYRIMMAVHMQGKGVCGIYPHDIAESKVKSVRELAKDHGFPLRASMEEA